MLKKEDNDRITRTGPGTPMGKVMRSYWVPAMLSSELPEPDGAPVRVRLLGEDLIAYRATDGRVGLIDQRCPHRGASLFFGRNEEQGLRCVYHGWKFDLDGACVETPNEPPESQVRAHVRATAYPCKEAGGVVWTYMGPSEKQPPFTTQEWMRLPEGAAFASKHIGECNWLQLLEGGFDMSHSSFLHRRMNWGAGGSGLKTQQIRARSTAPKQDIAVTEFGYSYAALRAMPEENKTYARVMQFVMPFHQMRTFEGNSNCPMVLGHIWVPMDDETTWIWSWMYAKDGRQLPPELIEEEERNAGRSAEFVAPGTFRFLRNRGNDYLIDRQMQKTVNYTGISGIASQDQALQESMGLVADRSIEHLGMSDMAVVTTRRLLLTACKDVEEGKAPLGSQLPAIAARAAEMILPAGAPWQDSMREELVAAK